MTLDERIDRELAFFTSEPHEASFELLPGTGRVLLSAPHAALQWRRGRSKQAERYTGMLCRLLHQSTGRPVLYKTRCLNDDANFDPQSDYRDALCDYARQSGVRLALDLHQLAPERPMALCVGTGRGEYLQGAPWLREAIETLFAPLGPVTWDEPFAAAGANTVAGDVYRRCGIAAVQLELNTALLTTACPGSVTYDFPGVLDALRALAELADARTA